MENFALTYDAIREVRPDVVMVSMPGWGLEGPWRDRPGFATTMEQASGMAFVTGYDDGPPMAPGLCDPLAGVHGAFAVLAALEERQRTGRGQHVEVPMIDLAVNVSAEQILEFEAYGELMTRRGNRCPQAAPQGVYACAGTDEWLALSVTTEEQWKALCEAIGFPAWAADPEACNRCSAVRSTRSDRPSDRRMVRGSSAQRRPRRARGSRGSAGRPGLCHRRGPSDAGPRLLGIGRPSRRRRAPLPRMAHAPLGQSSGLVPIIRRRCSAQHNVEVLSGLLGLADDEIADLQASGVIGERPLFRPLTDRAQTVPVPL